MKQSSIKNIFESIPLNDLIIYSDDENTFEMGDINIISISNESQIKGFIDGFNEFTLRSPSSKFLKISCDGKEILLLNKDLYPVLHELSKVKNLGTQHFFRILEKYDYGFINMTELEKYSPSGGFLYNLTKEKKSRTFNLTRDGRVIGITSFDWIVLQVKKQLERYY